MKEQRVHIFINPESKLRARGTLARKKGGGIIPRLIKNPKTREYELNLKSQLQQVWSGSPFKGPLLIEVLFFFEGIPHGQIMPVGKPDLDNLTKALKDAANGVCWDDDMQVVGYGGVYKVKAPYGGIQLTVRRIQKGVMLDTLLVL